MPMQDAPPETFGLLAAAKPIYWAAATLAALVWGVYAFVGRIERIESDVQDIKYILCASAPASTDTACKDYQR